MLALFTDERFALERILDLHEQNAPAGFFLEVFDEVSAVETPQPAMRLVEVAGELLKVERETVREEHSILTFSEVMAEVAAKGFVAQLVE